LVYKIQNSLKNKKVLVTLGPTWIPIDDTRVLSNVSSGALGQMIAEELDKQDAKVTVFQGPTQCQIKSARIRVFHFKFFDELKALLNRALKNNFDIIIHAAAVSDYKLKKNFKTKISSSLKTLKLELIPNEKLIDLIRRKNPKAYLVGFKLISQINQSIARKRSAELFKRAKCDLIIANSLANKQYKGCILNLNEIISWHNTRQGIAKALIAFLNKQ